MKIYYLGGFYWKIFVGKMGKFSKKWEKLEKLINGNLKMEKFPIWKIYALPHFLKIIELFK